MSDSIEYVVAIDPSINSVGCAIFKKKTKQLVAKILLHPGKISKESYLSKARDIIDQITDVMFKYDTRPGYPSVQLVTEIPQHFGVGGYMARESGAILKLTFIAGMIYNITDTVISYEPNQWKGQLPKDVVARRLQKLYPEENIYDVKKKKFIMDHNVVDACAIGHVYLYGHI